MKKRIFSMVIASLLVMTMFVGYLPAKEVSAKVVVPQIEFANPPVTQYNVGDRVNFNIHAPNYGGRVQYRVVLWNDSKKSYYDLWNAGNGYPEKYYTKWQPYGNNIFTLGWIIFEPGSYRITVYAKRAGIPNSKTAKKGYNCDSYMESVAFTVKEKEAMIESILPIDDITVNVGETPRLPSYVKASTDDGFIKELRVSWASVSTTTPGTYTVEGTVEGTNKKAYVKVKVNGQTAVTVNSVNSPNNTLVNIQLKDVIDFAPSSSIFTIKQQNTTDSVPVYQVGLSADKKMITLSTGYMTTNVWYTLTVNNNTYNFVANFGNTYGISLAGQNKNIAIYETAYANVAKYPTDVILSYSSSNTSVATVDSSTGLITGRAPGLATITVNGSKYGYTNATTTFLVTVGSQNGMFAYAQDIEVNAGAEKMPYVSKNPSDLYLNFTSNNPSIATVDYSTGMVKGVSAGTATITIAANKYGYSTFYSTFKVTVIGQLANAVAIPSILSEAPTNDGSFEQKPIEIFLTGSSFISWGYNGYYKNYIQVNNLPYGLDYYVESVSSNTMKLYITGKAYNHKNSNDTNIKVTIAKELVVGATAEIVSNNIYLDFTDVSAPAAPTNPIVLDAMDTFGWTNVPGYDSISDYEYSVDNGDHYINCTANPQVVGNGTYATGTVKVRVKAIAGRSAGIPLASDKPFTKVADANAPILRSLSIYFKDGSGFYNMLADTSGIYSMPAIIKGKEIIGMEIKVDDNNLNTSPVSLRDARTGSVYGTLNYDAGTGLWKLNHSAGSGILLNTNGAFSLAATFRDADNQTTAYMNFNVIEVVGIDDLSYRAVQNEPFILPDTVMARLSNNTTTLLRVTWSPNTIDTTELGPNVVYGTVAGYDKLVKLTVDVYSKATIYKIANLAEELFVGDSYELPKQLMATMSDKTQRLVDVAWDPTSVDTSKAGVFTFTGTVVGYEPKVIFTITIKEKAN